MENLFNDDLDLGSSDESYNEIDNETDSETDDGSDNVLIIIKALCMAQMGPYIKTQSYLLYN